MNSQSSVSASNGSKIIAMLLLGVLIGLGMKGMVFAATSVVSPGTCFRGGTTIQLSWSLDPTASHGYLSIWQGTNQPTYANGQPPIVGGHFATSPISWPLPTVTASGYQSHVESHTPGHSVINSAESAPFAIDSTEPLASTLTAGTATASTVALSWSPVTDGGCMGLSGYKLYRGAQLVTTTTGTSFTDTGLTASTSYTYNVVAYDGFASSPASNMTTKSTAAAPVVPPPVQAPAPSPQPTTTSTTATSTEPAAATPHPSGKISCANVSTTTQDIIFQSAETTQVGLFRGTTLLVGYTAANKSGTFHDTGLTAATSYDYTLRAGTKSSASQLAKVTCKTSADAVVTPPTVAPAKPIPTTNTKVSLPNVAALVPRIVAASTTKADAIPQHKPVALVIGGITLPLAVGAAVLTWQLRLRKRA